MQPNPGRFDQTGRSSSSISRLLTSCLLLSLLLCSANGWGQALPGNDSMPPWTVLALKLVSATHVQPTTGIVIGAPDLVLVALDFAREGDEVMVLDGGTDIVRHGRPARIIHTLPADKLAILKVQGLNRPAARLSALSEAELKALNLVAFPPAEMIAQGAAPVRASIKALPAITTTHPTLDPFPNVSAALMDSCGNLVAFNLADDVQSMQPAASPRVAWPDALKRAAKLAGTPLAVAPCDAADAADEQATTAAAAAPEKAAPEEAEEPPVESAGADQEVVENEQENESVPSEPDADQELPDQELVDETEAAPADGSLDFEQDTAEPDPLAEAASESTSDETEANANTAVESTSGPSPILAILALLAVLSALAWWVYRQKAAKASNKSPARADAKQHSSTVETGFSEPGTVRFAAGTKATEQLYLQMQGQLPDGQHINQLRPIDSPEWQAEIGRQDADIVLASVLLSRRHAKVQVQNGHITISDLGSTNGSRLNDVPCLPGEVFLVQSSDIVQLGDVTLKLQLTADSD